MLPPRRFHLALVLAAVLGFALAMLVATGGPISAITGTDTGTVTTGTGTTTTETTTTHVAKDPRKDPWPKLTDDEKKRIQDLLDESPAKRQEALDEMVKTLSNYCCSFATMKDGKPKLADLPPGVRGRTQGTKGGLVEVGGRAFSSASVLESVIKHEAVHSMQWQDPEAAEKLGKNAREAEAYQRELDNADNTGLSEEERKGAEKKRNEYQKKADAEKKGSQRGSSPQGTGSAPRDPRGRADLRFRISLRGSSFALGQPIPLTLTLCNASSRPLTVNGRLLFNDPAVPSLFREVAIDVKTPRGRRAPFLWDFNADFPEPGDFPRLGARRCVSQSLDLEEYYGVTERGRYRLRAEYANNSRGPLVFDETTKEFVELDVGAVRATVGSNQVKFSVT